MTAADDIAPEIAVVERRAATPVAGAIAGILFAVLFSASIALMHTTMSGLATDTGDWLHYGATRFRFAVGLLPFAGIFFLWFIAVSREHVGRREDQFFATVFLGSGLMFLAMVFSAGAVAGAMVASYSKDVAAFAGSSTYVFARYMLSQVFTVYALRMASVFVISQATIWMRTGAMPKWMAFVSYAVALVMLFVVSHANIVVLIFPAWVFLVSVYILVIQLRRT